MANEQTENKRPSAIDQMGKEMGYLLTAGAMPWQKAMQKPDEAFHIERPFDAGNHVRLMGPNAPVAVLLAGNMALHKTSDPRFFTYKSAKKAGDYGHVMKNMRGQLVEMSFFSKKDKDGNLLPRPEQRWVSFDEFFFRADQVALGKPAVNEQGEIVTRVLEKDGKPVLDKDGEKVTVPVTDDIRLPEYTPSPKITAEEAYQVGQLMFDKGIAALGITVVEDEKDEKAFYKNSEKEIHLPTADTYRDSMAYLSAGLRQLAMAQVQNGIKREGQEEKNFTPRAINHFKAEVVALNLAMDLGIPVDATKRMDFRKELSEHFKKYPMDYIKAVREAGNATREIKERAQDKLNEIFKQEEKSGLTYEKNLEAAAKELENKQIEMFGGKIVNSYKRAFKEVYEQGGKLFKEQQMKSGENRYMQFIYQKAFSYGLSSARPDNDAGWRKADRDFVMQFAKEHYGRESAVVEAGMAVQKHSPYAKVINEKEYGKEITKVVLGSDEFKNLQKQEPAKEVAAPTR